jgi:hypothetical protein
VISVSSAGAAGTLRVQVWRKLRSLGAVHLQQSVCVLPAGDDMVRQFRRLTDRIHHQGGTARVLRMRFTDPADEQSLIEEFNTARDAEYAEILERIPALREELAHERARGRVSAAGRPTPRWRSPKRTWNASAAGWPRSPPATTSPPRAVRPPAWPSTRRRPTWRRSNNSRCRQKTPAGLWHNIRNG